MNEVELNKQVEELKEVAAKSINPCLTAKFIAFSDARVRALFLSKIQDEYIFKGVFCLSGLSIPENRSVYFDFDCPADRVCLIKPAFVVVVNVVHGYVVPIIDPYTDPTASADFQSFSTAATRSLVESGGASLRIIGNSAISPSGGTLPLASDGTLPLASDGTLPLASDGTLPLRVIGYVLMPAGWRFGNG
ncbi:MAG: hypothetical protein WD049_01930 [Candidatus Paceibacterota bacterium]